MKPIRRWQADEEEKKKTNSDILIGIERITAAHDTNQAAVIEKLKIKTMKLVKPANEHGLKK